MNIVSFSLYGKDEKYQHGAIRNAEQIKRFYPDFFPLFYIGEGVKKECIETLEKLGARIRMMGGRTQMSNLMMWRHTAIDIPKADVVLVRDCDSRFSDRESRAVDQWLRSEAGFHVMRDYPAHGVPIMGGMWGWKKKLKVNRVYDSAVNWLRQGENREKKNDQHFLAEILWPQVKHSVMQHDSFFRDKFPGSLAFPDGDKTGDGSFVGEVFDANDKPQQVCRDARFVGRSAG